MGENEREAFWKALIKAFFMSFMKASAGLLAVWAFSYLPFIKPSIDKYKERLVHEESSARSKSILDSTLLQPTIKFEKLKLRYHIDSWSHDDSAVKKDSLSLDSIKKALEIQ